jgi:hypothetical protein
MVEPYSFGFGLSLRRFFGEVLFLGSALRLRVVSRELPFQHTILREVVIGTEPFLIEDTTWGRVERWETEFSGAVWAGGRADLGSGLFFDISALAGYGRDIGLEGEARVSFGVESQSFFLGVDLSVGTGVTDLFRGRVSIGLRGGIGL